MFYTFGQNNPGGSFIVDDTVCHYVIIEADDYALANDLAEYKGIYFNGCDDDIDCPCCGDRWSEVYKNDGTDEPLIYSEKPDVYDDIFAERGEVYCRVFYQNGDVKEFVK